MPYTVRAVAELVGVSVRALDHYDHVGLLKPASSSPAGYRLYTAPDLERRQRLDVLLGSLDPEVQALVAEHHRVINEKFYDCPPEVYRGLGDMYVDDSRFTAFYDAKHPGLAAFLRSAVHLYADTLEASG